MVETGGVRVTIKEHAPNHHASGVVWKVPTQTIDRAKDEGAKGKGYGAVKFLEVHLGIVER